MSPLEQFAKGTLEKLDHDGLLRDSSDGLRARAVDAAQRLGRPVVDAFSNDYLGLAGGDVSRETPVQSRAPSGAGASRLIHGTHAEHVALEAELAAWVGFESALLFSAGYTANVGIAQALGGPGSVFVSDALNHASLIDGCRLSRARVEVVPHLSLEGADRCLAEHAGAALRCVITESYFSMDGDGPDLRLLRALCDRHDAVLVVDEAHALGVFGAEGAGRCQALGVTPDVLVGTLGKSVGTQGAFVASSARVRELLWNRARSFVFSTAPSPALAKLSMFHVTGTRAPPGAPPRLDELARTLRSGLAERRVPMVSGSFGPIVPLLVGHERRALEVVERLADEGVLAQAIRPPTVPPGTARVRLTVKATWQDDTPARVASAVASTLSK
jgi:8-amino-7-oxononanoate synthase